jgi:hypothetical protein
VIEKYMDVRQIGERYLRDRKRSEEGRRKYPLHAIAIPTQFPFLISLAKSRIQQDPEGRTILQQKSVPVGEGLFPSPIDAWEMRNQFLRLKQTDDELLGFFNQFGWWDPARTSIPVEEVWAFKETLKQVLCWPEKARGKQLSQTGFQGLPGLFSTRLQATFEYSDGSPKFVVLTSGCADAMIATLQCDLARGKEFRKCERRGCDVTFPVTNKHDREYHDRECQHAALVQRRREEQRKKKAEIRATSQRSK